MADHASDEFDAMVEAVRVGSIFSRDQKAYDRWRRRQRRDRQPRAALSAIELERAVMGIAAMFPDNVIRGTVPA